MLLLGVFSPSQLVKMCPGFVQEIEDLPGISSLHTSPLEMKTDMLYSFKLDAQEDITVLNKLTFNAFTQKFGCLSTAVSAAQSTGTFNPVKLRLAEAHKDLVQKRRADSWASNHQMLQSHISTIAETRQSHEISPSFTPCKQRQMISQETEAYLKKSQLAIEKRLTVMKKRKGEQESGLASIFKGTSIRPLPVTSEKVSPNTNEVNISN